jgi:folate-binding protein YgfZ
LPQEALLHIEGPDTLTFLQGQTTCDTREIGPTRGALGAYCTPQGRVVCDFLLATLGAEHVALRMRRDILEPAAAVFGKYIVFSRAELDPGRDGWRVAALWGPSAEDVLRDTLGTAPATPLDAVCEPGITVVRRDGADAAFECYGAAENPLFDRLAAAADAGTENDWQLREIRAGVGRIEAATMERFVPQVLNYDLTGHVNFTKGCYTGQEVVARLHYRGTSKRRAFLAQLDSPAEPGAALFSAGGTQAVGDVVNCAPAAAGFEALVSATTASADSTLRLGSADGPAVSLSPPPYGFPADES